MALLDIHFFSKILMNQAAVSVLLPDEGEGPFPVLYLLHGISNDHTHWVRKSNVERYAAAHRLAVVMPSVGRSYYADQKVGYDYFTYVAQELPQVMGAMFPLSQRRDDTFVAGLSMGGYGAVKLALNYPERYGAAASFSGCLDLEGLIGSMTAQGLASQPLPDKLRRGADELKRALGSPEEFSGSPNDLMSLAKAADPARCPALYLSCGTEDPLMGCNRSFTAMLDQNGIPYTWFDGPGGHDWEFWDSQIRQALEWMEEEGGLHGGHTR